MGFRIDLFLESTNMPEEREIVPKVRLPPFAV
jgi:hypothetical protein